MSIGKVKCKKTGREIKVIRQKEVKGNHDVISALQSALDTARDQEITSVALVMGGPDIFHTDYAGYSYSEIASGTNILNTKVVNEWLER